MKKIVPTNSIRAGSRMKTIIGIPHLPFLLPLWIITLAVYLKTLAPSILYVDAGTMVAAAGSLGIPNPPGFPTYVLVSNLFTKIPWGTVLFRVQLLSVFSAVGVLTLVYFLLHRFLASDFLFVKKTLSDKELFSKTIFKNLKPLSDRTIKICALTGALILAFSYQFWSQALNSESYIFTNFLMISMLALILTIPQSAKNITKRVVLGAALLGIASGANPTIIQAVPALFLATIFFWKKVGFKRLILIGVVTALFTALVYSYLPIRASQYPFLNWGNPQTPELFWGHLKGEGLDINDPRTNSINGFTGSPQIFARSTGRYFYLSLLQFTPILVPFIILGAYYLFKKNKKLFLSLLTVPVVNLIFGGLYLSGNQESWFIASYVIFAMFIGIGISFGLKISLSYLRNLSCLSYLPLFLILLPFLWWFPKLDRSSQIVTSEYADNLYAKLPPNAVLIGSGDFFNSLANYEHEVVKRRTDVFPVVANMWYILPWYRDNLRHQKPELMPKELETMIKKDRLEEYNEVMNWYIKWLIDKGYPVYVTPTVFRETVLAGTDAGRYVPDKTKVKAVEQGLAYRMLIANDLLEPSDDAFKYTFKDPEFFKHPPFYLERNYSAGYHLLLQEYGAGYLSMADYFLNNIKAMPTDEDKNKTKQKAFEYLKKAYEIAPFSSEVVNRVAIFTAMQGDLQQGIKYFKEASDLDPNSFEIRLNLAKALTAAGREDEAKKELQIIVSSSPNSQLRDEAQSELSKVAVKQLSGSIPADWKSFEVKNQGFGFAYPADWKVSSQGNVTVISAPEEGFTISIYGGVFTNDKDSWIQKSPIKFTGKLENKGPAQIPPFDAAAAFWAESDSKKSLEFILAQEKHILHLKIKPADSKMMQKLDQILSTIKFNK